MVATLPMNYHAFLNVMKMIEASVSRPLPDCANVMNIII